MKNKISWKPIENSLDLPDEVVLRSPIGMFRANNPESPFNQFKFEAMNTNFRIMKSMIHLLNTTEGIDSCIVISPYCVILSIARLFDSDRVKSLIELRLVGRILNTEVPIEAIPDNLRTKLKDSGTLVFPNGHIEYIGKEDEEEDREVMKKCAELVGGIYYENI